MEFTRVNFLHATPAPITMQLKGSRWSPKNRRDPLAPAFKHIPLETDGRADKSTVLPLLFHIDPV